MFSKNIYICRMKINSIKNYFSIIELLKKGGEYTRKEIMTRLRLTVDKKTVQNYLNGQVGNYFGFNDYNNSPEKERLIIKRSKYYSLNFDNYNKIRKKYNELSKQAFINSYLLDSGLSIQKHLDFDFIESDSILDLETIIDAIEDRKKLIIDYVDFNNFKGELLEEQIEIEPYILKSYLNRFFIIGKRVDTKEVKPFALYKTKNILYSGVNFNMPPIEPIKKKYSEIVGVTHYDDNPAKPPKVVIEFSNYQFNYFRTEPWVEDYKIEEHTKDYKTVKLSFYVHPNNELHQRILFNNAKCRVLEPKSLVDRIKEILTTTLSLYK